MMISYSKIKEIFGSKDEDGVDQIVLILSIHLPNLSSKDLVQIFQITLDSYYSKEDEILDFTSWTNSKYSGKNMLEISENRVDPKENLHSTYIFRNLYRLIRDTNMFDSILEERSFVKSMIQIKNKIVKVLQKNYRNQKMLDQFEVVCEFIELIQKKIDSLSEA